MSRRHHGHCRRGWRHPRPSISDRRLYRDPARGRIAGVCAGLADYFGVSTTMTRFALVTALIFVPQITFFAYLIAAFVLPKREDLEALAEPGAGDAFEAEYARERERVRAFGRTLEHEPELDRRRFAVRHARTRLADIETRMRALEAYVTSKRFDLDREIGRL